MKCFIAFRGNFLLLFHQTLESFFFHLVRNRVAERFACGAGFERKLECPDFIKTHFFDKIE